MMQKVPRPDWNVWENMDRITSEEGALLTMDYCPNAIRAFKNEFLWSGTPTLQAWAALVNIIGHENAEAYNERECVLSIAFRDHLTLADLQILGPSLGWHLPEALVIGDVSHRRTLDLTIKEGSSTNRQTKTQLDQSVWKLTKPARFQGYRRPLYEVLKIAKATNAPQPTAREVLEHFRSKQPPEVHMVLTDGFDYYDASGNVKAASLDSLRKAIDRLVR